MLQPNETNHDAPPPALQSAVMPDFRPRAWWCPALKAGLLFSCKNGAVCMEQPIGARLGWMRNAVAANVCEGALEVRALF